MYKDAILRVISNIITKNEKNNFEDIVTCLLQIMGKRFEVIDSHYMHLFEIFHKLFDGMDPSVKVVYVQVPEIDACLKVRRGTVLNTMIYLNLTPNQEICKFYLKNKCKFGDKCLNIHTHPKINNYEEDYDNMSDLTSEDGDDKTYINYDPTIIYCKNNTNEATFIADAYYTLLDDNTIV